MSKLFVGMAGALLALSFSASLAMAGGDESITARKACMKANGAGMGVMVPMIKGEKPYDAAAVKTALETMGKACSAWDTFWPEDSKTSTTQKTHASEAIWTDKAGFAAAGEAAYKAETALAATTDEAGFKAAFPAVGAACGACHKAFRTAME
jgi:cytochrome c556